MQNYGRFYAIFNRLPYHGDREELKRDLVLQATGGRTDSLREVSRQEYDDLCKSMERMLPGGRGREAAREELRRQRSIALHQMQKMGVDTTDWNRINALCQDMRIAGKPFGRLSGEELGEMTVRLRAIARKGGFRNLDEPVEKAKIIDINHS